MKNYTALDWVALALIIVGGINWGMIGAFNLDLVSLLFGDMSILTRSIYGLVGLSAMYMAATALYLSDTTDNRRVAHS